LQATRLGRWKRPRPLLRSGWPTGGGLTDKARQERRAEGQKEPKPWDEATWRSKTKLRPVRSKPYELRDAAMQCADLARKAGWLDVVVLEVAKSKQPAGAALV
jgi:hypothetical protein